MGRKEKLEHKVDIKGVGSSITVFYGCLDMIKKNLHRGDYGIFIQMLDERYKKLSKQYSRIKIDELNEDRFPIHIYYSFNYFLSNFGEEWSKTKIAISNSKTNEALSRIDNCNHLTWNLEMLAKAHSRTEFYKNHSRKVNKSYEERY